MELKEMRNLVDEAIDNGYLIKSGGTVLSTSIGYHYAGRAVLGALLENLGSVNLNKYIKNQKSMLGWLVSKSNPIAGQARSILKEMNANDKTKSAFSDCKREFIDPIIQEHTMMGGKCPSDTEINATCAMLLAKIAWDCNYSNTDLANHIATYKDSLDKTN
jgi:hypothetical protein